MKDLKINVNGQTLSKENSSDWNDIMIGSIGYIRFVFIFDSDWKQCPRKAVHFESEGLDTFMPVINGICVLPDEFANAKKVKISLIGEKDDEYRITTNTLEVRQK